MRKVTLFVLPALLPALLFVLPASVYAGESSSDSESASAEEHSAPASLNPGPESRALLFGLGSNLNLTNFRGGMFSYKWFSSSTRAQRITANVFVAYDVRDNEVTAQNNTASQDATDFDTRIQLSYDIMRYREVTRNLYSYFAFGPTAHFNYRIVDTEQISGQNSLETEIRTYSVGAGSSLSLGTEWFVNRSISISGEYSIDLSYRFESRSEERITSGPNVQQEQTDDRTSSRITLGGSGARVGISVYF